MDGEGSDRVKADKQFKAKYSDRFATLSVCGAVVTLICSCSRTLQLFKYHYLRDVVPFNGQLFGERLAAVWYDEV